MCRVTTLVLLLVVSSLALAQGGGTAQAGGESECSEANIERSEHQLIHKVAPKYPPKAREARIEGTVALWVAIGKDGKVTILRSDSGPAELIPAAMKAVKQWRYEPFRCNGKPIEVHTDIHVSFSLSHCGTAVC